MHILCPGLYVSYIKNNSSTRGDQVKAGKKGRAEKCPASDKRGADTRKAPVGAGCWAVVICGTSCSTKWLGQQVSHLR